MLPDREAAWKIIKERLDILVETCASLAKDPGLGALAQLAERLHSMSQDVGQRLAERTAQAGAYPLRDRRAGSPDRQRHRVRALRRCNAYWLSLIAANSALTAP